MKKVKIINRFLFSLLLIVSIFGLSNVQAATKNIEVKEISLKDKSGTITVIDPVLNENEVTSNITFNQVDDFVTFELTLKNNESEKYKVKSVTDNNTNENIKTEYTFSEDYIESGATGKVTIKLTYKNKLINQDYSINDLKITLTLENEAGVSEEVIINPVTGDNIFHYLVLLIVALVGIGLIIAKKKIKGIKVGSFLIVLSLIMIPFAALASDKYEIQVKFTNIEIKGEFETYSITIDSKNGTTPTVKDITYGDPIGELPTDPSKDGYEFDKWVDGDGNEVTPDTVITGPIEVEAKYNIIEYNITYNLGDGSLPSGKTNPSKYTIESDDITLNNPELVGYTFIGWTGTGIDTQTTSVTISKGSKDDRSYEAHYSANGNTAYKVIHKFAKLTEGYDEEEVTEYGTTGSTVPAPRKSRTGFKTPAVQNVTIKGDGSASITYTYERETYTVTFDTDGGSTVANQTITYEQNATRPTTNPTKTGYTFDDWYTDDTYQTVFDFTNTSIIEDTTIYGKFDELTVCANNENITNLSETTCSANENITVGDGIVCKRAVKLHEETCSQTSFNCNAAGYSAGGSKGTSTITYGNCGTGGTLTSGDAFTCDVNGDGTFDEITERFYYVSDYYDTSTKTFDTSTAVLIYYNNVTSGVSCNKSTYAYDSSNTNYNGPRTLVSQLPTTNQWSNVSLKNTSRQILAQNGNTSTSGGSLPIFDYSGYAARLITAQELNSACGITIGSDTAGELDSCNFIMENTKYAKSSIKNFGPWLETPLASNSYFVLYVNSVGRRVGNYYRANYTSDYGARPAIEVLKSNISY